MSLYYNGSSYAIVREYRESRNVLFCDHALVCTVHCILFSKLGTGTFE